MWRSKDHRHVKVMLDGESQDKRRRSRLARWSRSVKISRAYLGLVTLCALLLFFLVSLTSSTTPRAKMRPILETSDDRSYSIPITSTLHSDRILILQHVYSAKTSFWHGLTSKHEEPLFHASLDSHEKYAKTWGYGFKVDRGSWLSGDSKRSKHLSKVYSLLHTVLEELAKEDTGAEWIMFADADTLILNPALAISEFLPPPTVQPSPLILANIDHRGFNAGVMVFKVSVQLAAFLMAMISNEAVLFAAMGIHPSDQHLVGYTLQESKHDAIKERFYVIPQRWLNSYWVEGNGPALHVHLVNQRKWQENWRHTVIEHADGVYTKAEELVNGIGGGHPEGTRAGLEMMDEWREGREAARRYWQGAKGGIDGVLFNSI